MINSGLAEAIMQRYLSPQQRRLVARDVAGGAVGSSSIPDMPKGLNGPAGPSVPDPPPEPVSPLDILRSKMSEAERNMQVALQRVAGIAPGAAASVPVTEWIPVQAMKEPAAFDTHSYICASAERVVVNGMPLNSKDEQIGYWRERYMAEKLRSAALQQEENPMWAQYLAAKRRITELSAENDALKAEVAAFTASSPPASDTPLPERRPDGTLKPVSKPWSAPVPNGDPRRVGG